MLDLHGQYVKEALLIAREAIEDAKSDGRISIRFIVGKASPEAPLHL